MRVLISRYSRGICRKIHPGKNGACFSGNCCLPINYNTSFGVDAYIVENITGMLEAPFIF